jgi:hypothetical protein
MEFQLLGGALIATAIVFIVSWFITALSLYLAGRAISGEEATFGEALIIALVGPILVGISSALITPLFGPYVGIILALVVWLWVVKSIFGVGWGAAFAIAVLALITFIVVVLVLGFLLGAALFLPFVL